MALYGGQRDISLFRHVNRELIGDVISQQCAYYKYKIEEIGQIESKDVFKQGQGLAESVTTGKVKASEPLDTDVSEEQDDEGDGKKVPF